MGPSVTALRGNLRRIGWTLIVAGAVCVLLPGLATLAIEWALGAILLLAGISQIALSLQAPPKRPYGWRLAMGVLHALVGVLLITNPFSGAVAMSLLLGVLFLLQAAWESSIAFRVRPVDGWGLLLASACFSALLGVLILAHWPSNAAWVVGVFVGANLILSGWAAIVLGRRPDAR